MNNIAIIYHDADFDGKLSNEVCRFHLEKIHPDAAIHSYGWDYGRQVPTPLHTWWDPKMGDQFSNDWALYDQIYIVDLSVDELMVRPSLRNKIVWIDHHKSAIDKWVQQGNNKYGFQFKGYRIDGVAACRLCWQWFTWNAVDPAVHLATKKEFIDRKVSEPELIRLAGEYDIWDHRDPNAKVLQYGLRCLKEDDMNALVKQQFDPKSNLNMLDMLKATLDWGYIVKLYCDKQNDEYSKSFSHTIQWEGLTFCALNIGQRGNSDLLQGGIKPEHQALFAWRFDGKQVNVSLYHAPGHEDIDLSKIAVKYGGGGHRGACGFRTSLSFIESLTK